MPTQMASSGMLRRVALVRTDISEELSASFIRVTRIVELGTLAVTSNRRTRINIPEDAILHSHRRENLKSYMWRIRLQAISYGSVLCLNDQGCRNLIKTVWNFV
jgi:hypothetical protein